VVDHIEWDILGSNLFTMETFVMYVFLQEGRIIIFNEWLCICFVGKHDSLGQMSSSFLGLLGANQRKFMVPWGKWPQILKSNMFSQGKWVQNMVLQGNPNSLVKTWFFGANRPNFFWTIMVLAEEIAWRNLGKCLFPSGSEGILVKFPYPQGSCKFLFF